MFIFFLSPLTGNYYFLSSLPLLLAIYRVEIKDVSGGCGDFYQILVVSPQFQGVTRIHTHRMVNDVLEKFIGKMHGLTLRTLTPAQYTELQKVKN